MSATNMNQDSERKLEHSKNISVPKVCNICNRQPYSLKRHMKVHDMSRMFQQTYMPEELVPELKEMGKVRLDNTVIEVNCVCSICLKIYSNWIQRRNHEKLHEDPEKHNWHMRNKSKEEKQVFKVCSSAKKSPFLVDSESYKINVNNVMGDSKKISQPTNYPFKCNICDRGVPSMESLQNHMNIHKCPSGCNKIFPTTSILKIHMINMHGTKKRLQKKELRAVEFTKINSENNLEETIGIKNMLKDVDDKFELTKDKLLNDKLITKDMKAIDKTNCSKLSNESQTVLKGNKFSGFYLSCTGCKSKFLSTKELKVHECIEIKVSEENMKLQPDFDVQEKASGLNKNEIKIQEKLQKIIETNDFSIDKSELVKNISKNYIHSPKNKSLINSQLLNYEKQFKKYSEGNFKNFLNIDNINDELNIKEETGYNSYENTTEDQKIIDAPSTQNKSEVEMNPETINSITNLALDIKPSPGDSSINLSKIRKFCTICNINFSYRMEFDIHSRKVHGKFRWTCSKCDKGFSTKIMLTQHITRLSGDQAFNCREGKHRTNKQIGKTFPCNFCAKHFQFKRKLRHHERKVHNQNRTFCQDCGKDFLNQGYLKTHMTAHTGEEKYNCREGCNQKFRVASNRYYHEKNHREEYKCKTCLDIFALKRSLKAHIKEKKHQPLKELKEQICIICQKQYSSSRKIKVHIREKHSQKQFPCSKCGKEFQSKIKLESHITVHTAERKFKCREGCSKTFRTHSSRFIHDRTHRGV